MTVVGGLPDSAVIDADVPDVGLADDAVDTDGSSASERADASPLQEVDSFGFNFLCEGGHAEGKSYSCGEGINQNFDQDVGEDSHIPILAVWLLKGKGDELKCFSVHSALKEFIQNLMNDRIWR